MLVLSLFPGIGMLDRAFELEGFCVVRGPDLLWGGDVRRFHPPAFRFDGVIGGPPCQAFSRATKMAKGLEPENLIPEFERVVSEAKPEWFLMENVVDAPTPWVDGFVVASHRVDNREDAGGIQRRLRRWSFGRWLRAPWVKPLELEWWGPPVPAEYAPTVTANATKWVGKPYCGNDGYVRRGRVRADRTRATLAASIHAQGLPDDFELPAFTVEAAIRAVGNGVPLPMGRAMARAVIRATSEPSFVSGGV
jgi:DNA (cytosine-5)-methyltransferase 1